MLIAHNASISSSMHIDIGDRHFLSGDEGFKSVHVKNPI